MNDQHLNKVTLKHKKFGTKKKQGQSKVKQSERSI